MWALYYPIVQTLLHEMVHPKLMNWHATSAEIIRSRSASCTYRVMDVGKVWFGQIPERFTSPNISLLSSTIYCFTFSFQTQFQYFFFFFLLLRWSTNVCYEVQWKLCHFHTWRHVEDNLNAWLMYVYIPPTNQTFLELLSWKQLS